MISTVASANLVNRPRRVLCNQRFRIGCSAFERWNVRRTSYVPQGDAYVTKKSATLDSFNRRISEKRAELFVRQSQVFPQRHARRRCPRREGCFVRNLGESIPWTDIQTIVATEDPISDERAKLQWNRTFQFDRQIRNAAARVQTMRSCDRPGRARFDAALTYPAAIRDWCVRWQFQRCQNLREKEPGAELRID